MSSDDNNTTKACDQFNAQDIDDNPSVASNSRILTDDALIHVFEYLSLKDLLAIESVSNQFGECVSSRLKSRKSLTIGLKGDGNNVDISCFSLIPNKHQLDSLLRKCPNIDSLNLQNTHMDYPTLEVIVNGWPQLTHLSLLDTVLDLKSAIYGNDYYKFKRLSQWLTPLERVPNNTRYVSLIDFIDYLAANRQSGQDLTQDLCLQLKSDHLKTFLKLFDITLPNYIHIQ